MNADDLDKFAESVLQRTFNTMYMNAYSSHWNLSISIPKTKIVFLRNGGNIRNVEKCHLNNEPIEVVDFISWNSHEL